MTHRDHSPPPPDPVAWSIHHGPRMYLVTVPEGNDRALYRRCTLWELRLAIREIMSNWDDHDDIWIEREPLDRLRVLAGTVMPCKPTRATLAEPKPKRKRKPTCESSEATQRTLF